VTAAPFVPPSGLLLVSPLVRRWVVRADTARRSQPARRIGWRNVVIGVASTVITRRRILYWLVVMVVVLVGGTIIGLIWADTSNVAGSIAVATNIIGVFGIVFLLIALAVVTRRQRRAR